MTLEDDTNRISYNPTSSIPPLTDPNPEGYQASEMEQTIAKLVEEDLFRYCTENTRNRLEPAGKYFACQAVYGIEVVFPQHKMNWAIDFRTDPIHLFRGKDLPANVVHQIAASALMGWFLRRKSFFYIRAYSRRFTTHHRIYGDAAGVHVIPVQLPDLLMHHLIYVAKGSSVSARQRIEYEIRQIQQGRESWQSNRAAISVFAARQHSGSPGKRGANLEATVLVQNVQAVQNVWNHWNFWNQLEPINF